jgi:hypothetical protein
MNRNGIDRKRRTRTRADSGDLLDAADGHREQLLGALRDCYGISIREAEYRFRQCVYSSDPALETDTDSENWRVHLH